MWVVVIVNEDEEDGEGEGRASGPRRERDCGLFDFRCVVVLAADIVGVEVSVEGPDGGVRGGYALGAI